MIRHTIRYELLVLRRNKRARLFTVAFPVLLLVVLSGLGGDEHTTFEGHPVTLQRFFLPGILAMALVTTCFAALVQIVVTRRQLGIYQRRRATPVPAHVLVGAQAVATTALAAVAAVVLLAVAGAAFGTTVSLGSLVAITLTFVVGALSLCAVAFAVASVIPSPDTAQPTVQLMMFPVLFISGIWFTTDGMPHVLKVVADLFPVAHLSTALHRAVEAPGFSDAVAPWHLLAVAAWGVAAGALAARRFSWLPSTRSA